MAKPAKFNYNIVGGKGDDHLLGTSGDDFIQGNAGHDWLEGKAGSDTLTGGRGGDVFAVRLGDGHDIVTDFNPTENDHVLFDFTNHYNQALFYDHVTGDGYSVTAWGGQEFVFNAVDINNDGVTDTTVTAVGQDSSITLLGFAPEDLWGWMFSGG